MTIGNICCSSESGSLRSDMERRTSGSLIIISLFVLSLCACAPLTEQQNFERDNRLNLAKEEFLQKEEACKRAGGAMQMQVTPLSKNGRHDYKSARCVGM